MVAENSTMKSAKEPPYVFECAIRDASDDPVAKAWRTFVRDGVDPHELAGVRPEVADSWVRCMAFGLDPFAQKLSRQVSDDEFEEVVRIYQPLIDVTKPLIGVMDDLGLSNDYILELVARNGASILRAGKLDLHSVIGPKDVFNETTMGTNAHTLCMRHKRPLQVVGYEHYCVNLHNLAASASPIIDENDVVVAALLLTQPLPADKNSEEYHKLLSHALGLVASVSSAIEYQLRLVRAATHIKNVDRRSADLFDRFERMQHMLDMTIDASSDPVMIVGLSGEIKKINPEAAHIVGRTQADAIGSSIDEVVGITWHDDFRGVRAGGRSSSVKVSIDGKSYMLRGSGIRNEKTGELESVLVRFEERSRRSIASSAQAIGDEAPVAFKDILGESPQIKSAIATGRRYAVTAENVLIVGESGAGKELFAQAIHNESRAEGPFMAINCAAIPPRLIESELFGYESGAFTGAERGGKPGKIELANGGTLFLDEIGDMPLELQATLLRVLENKRVMRLGGKTYKQVDFRVIAATNRDLVTMVQDGVFREDLLYRLAILTVELPPLREREGDALFFAKFFLNECRRKEPSGPRGFTQRAMRFIEAYHWPGNVRQVKNAVYSAYYATDKGEIDVGDFPSFALRSFERVAGRSFSAAQGMSESGAGARGRLDAPSPAGDKPARLGEREDAGARDVVQAPGAGKTQGADGCAVAGGSESAGVPCDDAPIDALSAIERAAHPVSMVDAEKAVIKLAVGHANGNVKEAAEMLGISKATLYRKLKEYGIG